MKKHPATITSHVLDTSRGLPAAGVPVSLEIDNSGIWERLALTHTDADGRLPVPFLSHPIEAARYRLTFNTSAYFAEQKIEAFYPYVQIAFEVRNPEVHHHIPLLLSPFGYTTYRGS